MGAAYLALSNPIALAAAQTPQALPPPKSPTNPLLVKIADVTPLNQPDLEEQPEVVYTPPAPVYVAPPAPVIGCGSDPQMAYIYTVESGCNTGAYNYLGCRGLGQACPGSKLPCSDSDWVCQDNWFRNYAVQAYGSISNAYFFRLNHNWW